MKFFNLSRIFILCSLAYLTAGCQQLLDALNDADKQDAVATNSDLGKAGKWTILVYLDADNNLEGAGVGDVQEMVNRAQAAGGFGANNYVYVLMDRIPGYSSSGMPNTFANFDGARLFEVVTGSGTLTSRSPGAYFSVGANDGATELNMGSGTLLENFTKWGLAQAAANGSDYVYLDIWDHGAGWGGQAYGGNAVAWDDTDSHDALSIDEIRTAITNAHAAGTSGGKKVTILGFDACYMGTAENILSFKDMVKIVIGSEEVEPGNGWDYENWLPTGDISPFDLASKVVTSYGTYYNNQGGSNVTLAAYDLTKSASLQGAIDNFVSAVGSTTSSQVTTARSQVQNYNNNMAVDLYHFAALMNIPESNGLKTAVSNMVIKETHTAGGSVRNSYGMSIYFPTSPSSYDSTYNNTVIATATKWDEFISGKLSTYQASTTEPGDATCGAEPNDSPSTAKAIHTFVTGGTPCTGYVYTSTDVDYYRFSLDALPTGVAQTTKTLTVSLTNIPAGANFDVYVFVPFFSPSSAIAIGGAAANNGSESFQIELSTGKVTYTAPNLSAYNGGICDPGSTTNILNQYGYCYGQGTIVTAAVPHNFYIIVRGKSNSYSQVGKYTLTVSAANVNIGAPVAND
ncbi:MAG: clostripain-related cysteine peptidase [Turneriella sp.]